mmetsp:Transcript_601/g.854  ORF Transcript_601/g.854 Transcript_601/m.854 type:complete len:264 (-) Transcript_601:104-895(-)
MDHHYNLDFLQRPRNSGNTVVTTFDHNPPPALGHAWNRTWAINFFQTLANRAHSSIGTAFLAASLFDRYIAWLTDNSGEEGQTHVVGGSTNSVSIVAACCFFIATKFHDGHKAPLASFYRSIQGCHPQALLAIERKMLYALNFDIMPRPQNCVHASMLEIQRSLDLPKFLCELSLRNLASRCTQILCWPDLTTERSPREVAQMILMETCWSVGAHTYFFAAQNWQDQRKVKILKKKKNSSTHHHQQQINSSNASTDTATILMK